MQIKVYYDENGGRERVLEELVPEIEAGLKKICREQHLKCYLGRKIGSRYATITINASLEVPVYNTYTYTAGYGWDARDLEIWWDKKYRKWRGRMPANSPGFGAFITYFMRRTKYLQWCHWARLDNAINELLDSLGVYAVVESAYGRIRDGREWDYIDPCDPRHEYWHNALHRPDIYGYCKDMPSEEELREKHTR